MPRQATSKTQAFGDGEAGPTMVYYQPERDTPDRHSGEHTCQWIFAVVRFVNSSKKHIQLAILNRKLQFVDNVGPPRWVNWFVSLDSCFLEELC